MCGIVGLFLKNPALEPRLGGLVAAMLETMTDRGPDSAGFAVYGAAAPGRVKLTLRVEGGIGASERLVGDLEAALGLQVDSVARDTHVVVSLPASAVDEARGLARRRARARAHRRRRAPHGALQGRRRARGGQRPLRPRRDGRHPRHRPYPHGDRIGGDHRRRAPLLDRRSTSASSTTARCRTTTPSAACCSARAWPSRPRTTPRSRPAT